ncbi:MAG: flagellar basal-body MS-ring/collar protein FliF [Opitutaceae bacterium]
MANLLNNLWSVWRQLGLNQRISLSLAAVVVIAAMAGMLAWASRPDMQLLYGRLDPKDAGDIAAALDAQSIPYRIEGGGGSIMVPRDQVHRIRMDLASKGIPTGGAIGFEIFDRGNFGISDFVQRTNYLRAIQGELSRTVSQLDGVRSARVMVVMPENRLLVTGASARATASVLVETGGRRLDLEAVDSVRSLVANAVEGLLVDDVVVVDNRGNVLSDALKEESIGGLTAGQIRYRREVEDYFGKKVESMLDVALGPGNAVVRVSVDVDASQSTTFEERFDPDGQVLRSQTTTEDTNSSRDVGSTPGAGASANLPSPEAGGGAPPSPATMAEEKRKTRTDSYEINRSTVETVRVGGDIRRITAAVFVAMKTTGEGAERKAEPRSAQELESLRQIVINALGIAPARNQSLDQIVALQEIDFADDPVVETVGVLQDEQKLHHWMDLGRSLVGVVLAVGAFGFFLRLLKRHKPSEASFELLRSDEDRRGGRSLDMSSEITPELLNDLIRQKPANVGYTLKEWMSASSQK